MSRYLELLLHSTEKKIRSEVGYLHLFCSGCGSVKVPQGRIVGGNETYEGEVLMTLIIFT